MLGLFLYERFSWSENLEFRKGEHICGLLAEAEEPLKASNQVWQNV